MAKTCDHISCTSKNGGPMICDKCGEEVKRSFMDDPAYARGIQGTNAARVKASEKGSYDYEQKRNEHKALEHWGSGGKGLIPQLHPQDPDRYVTSEKEKAEVYAKNGLCMDTGQVIDEAKFEARVKEVRKKNRKTGSQKRPKRGKKKASN